MKILILSDTHIPHRAKQLPKEVTDEILTCDAIIHAGDFTSLSFYQDLQLLKKPFYAVRGNMDDDELYSLLHETLVFSLEGLNIGLYHGIGAPWGIEKKVLEKFKEAADLNLIIFGHSHKPMKKEENGIILFNPGSPTDTIFAPRRSYGILEVKEGKILRLDHVFL
ncbi:MAG: metallophosphoesterase [bacterium]|nr:metallophosphoesterase [bacterium]